MSRCAICLNTMKGGILSKTSCGHIFHNHCINESLTLSSPKCPLCRAVIEIIPKGAAQAFIPPGYKIKECLMCQIKFIAGKGYYARFDYCDSCHPKYALPKIQHRCIH